jgi:hypothetical protein
VEAISYSLLSTNELRGFAPQEFAHSPPQIEIPTGIVGDNLKQIDSVGTLKERKAK